MAIKIICFESEIISGKFVFFVFLGIRDYRVREGGLVRNWYKVGVSAQSVGLWFQLIVFGVVIDSWAGFGTVECFGVDRLSWVRVKNSETWEILRMDGIIENLWDSHVVILIMNGLM